jgi:hypothetical protein
VSHACHISKNFKNFAFFFLLETPQISLSLSLSSCDRQGTVSDRQGTFNRPLPWTSLPVFIKKWCRNFIKTSFFHFSNKFHDVDRQGRVECPLPITTPLSLSFTLSNLSVTLSFQFVLVEYVDVASAGR